MIEEAGKEQSSITCSSPEGADLSITNPKEMTMENATKLNAMLAVYQAAREALLRAAATADEAVQAIQSGNANLAVGTAMGAEMDVELAAKMLDTAVALHRAGPTHSAG